MRFTSLSPSEPFDAFDVVDLVVFRFLFRATHLFILSSTFYISVLPCRIPFSRSGYISRGRGNRKQRLAISSSDQLAYQLSLAAQSLQVPIDLTMPRSALIRLPHSLDCPPEKTETDMAAKNSATDQTLENQNEEELNSLHSKIKSLRSVR